MSIVTNNSTILLAIKLTIGHQKISSSKALIQHDYKSAKRREKKHTQIECNIIPLESSDDNSTQINVCGLFSVIELRKYRDPHILIRGNFSTKFMTKKKTEDIWGKNCFICICLQIAEQIIWQINVDANSVRKKNMNNNNMKS